MIQWLIDNKEWIFSGVGIFLLSAIAVRYKIRPSQQQRSGRNSVNIQAGNDISISEDIPMVNDRD